MGLKWLAALAVLGAAASSSAQVGRLGFTVAEDGSILREGKPFRGIGVNHVPGELFPTTGGAGTPPPETVIPQAAAAGIPFMRIMFTAFHPIDFPTNQTQLNAQLAILDRWVNIAEQNGIGLILNFFWQYCSPADISGEPVSAWGNANSLTRAFMRDRMALIVNRYKERRSVYGWEFSNEMNLFVDVPGGAYSFWPTITSLGYPATRTAADETTNAGMRSAISEFASLMATLDPYRRIRSTGQSLPRPSAWNLRAGLEWGVDTYAQFKEMVEFQNPDVDVLSGHAYTSEAGSPYFDDRPRVAWFKQAADEIGRPAALFEWGASGTGAEAPVWFSDYLNAIEASQIPLSALWVFQNPHQPEWSVSPSNSRSYQLTALTAANQRFALTTPDATGTFTAPEGTKLPSTLDVSLRNPGGTHRLTVAMDFNGANFSVRLPAKQSWDVSLKYRAYLRRTFTVNASSGSVSVGNIPLINGDVNNDNRIDAADELIVRANMGQPGRTQSRTFADLNLDGRVTTADLKIVLRSMGAVGDN